MKKLKNFKQLNESFGSEYFLIQEDDGNCLYFVGIYEKLEDFIKEYKEYLSEKEGISIDDIDYTSWGRFSGAEKPFILFSIPTEKYKIRYSKIKSNKIEIE